MFYESFLIIDVYMCELWDFVCEYWDKMNYVGNILRIKFFGVIFVCYF